MLGKVGMPALFVVQVCILTLLVVFIVQFGSPWTPAKIVGAILIIGAAAMLMTARYQLGKSFAVTAQARQLVTHGIYSRIRNPIYVFGAVLFLGVCIFFQRPYLFALLAAMIIIQIWRAHQEARVLEAKFGDAYRQYRKRTWF